LVWSVALPLLPASPARSPLPAHAKDDTILSDATYAHMVNTSIVAPIIR